MNTKIQPLRKIAVITGSRAEYWLLRPLISKLKASNMLCLMVTGEHLKGPGLEKIKNDQFKVEQTVECLSLDDSYLAMTKAIARGIANFADAFNEHKPDIIVLLGDRYETFAAATAAFTLKIPIAHIHGGELTHGALDDGFRHAISKLANLHFTSHDIYKSRLMRMGADPASVHMVGAIGLDNLFQFKPNSECEFFANYPSLRKNNYFLLTLHSTTRSRESSEIQAEQVCDALNKFPDYQIVITQSNCDPDGILLNKIWSQWADKEKRVHFIPILGDDYLHIAYFSKLVIGNSSSGILEIPYLNRPVLNIGDRQKGRVFPRGVYQADFNAESIIKIINEILTSYSDSEKLYGMPGEISAAIATTLESVPLESLIYGKFYDANE